MKTLLIILLGLFFLTGCFEKEETPEPQQTETVTVDSVQLFMDWLKAKKWQCDSINLQVNTDESHNVIFRNPQPFTFQLYKDTLYTFTNSQPISFSTEGTFQINPSQKTVTMKSSTYELVKLSETRMNLKDLYTGDIYKYKLVN